ESGEAQTRVARLIDFGLKQEDLERLQTMPELAAIVPLRDTEQRVVRGDLRVQANAIGTTPRIFEIINLRLSRGQFFDQVQYDRGQAATEARKRIEYSEVWLQARGNADVERLAGVAENLVSIDKGGKRGDVEIKAPIQILRAAERTQRTFNFIMVGIACFALVVGGIGIMNIMLATVTERTREIGIRRALGAKRRDIARQFLVETVVLSIAGGLTGVFVGLTCGPVINTVRDLLKSMFPAAME